jgi:uncharacterized protein (TIGR02246 family)
MSAEADEAAIRAIVADVERGFNENDTTLMNRHIAPDATVVDALGREHRGRPAIDAASVAGLAGPLADRRARYRVTDVTFVRPDVALAHKRAWAIDAADGTSTPGTPWSPSTSSPGRTAAGGSGPARTPSSPRADHAMVAADADIGGAEPWLRLPEDPLL